jgi:hypothetical protein
MAKWVCPQCRARFPFQSGVDPECPDCGYTLTDRSNNGVAAPRIGYFKNKSADRIYRQEEAASRDRAHMAAEITGDSFSDMSAMLQTNQKDGLRAGDTSAPSIRPDNQVAAALAAAPPPSPQAAPMYGAAGNSAGLAFSAAVAQGPMPNMGARTQQKIRDFHGTGLSGHAGALKSDMPANEVTNQLYRPRV